jgi:hypothetical protein
MAVNDTSAGTVLIKQPADIQVTDASISSSAVVESESVVTTATVKNTGGEAGTFTAGLEINGSTADTASITVDPQTTETVRFESPFSNSGIYLITVNNTYAGELIVDEPVNVAVRPSNPTAGERVTIVAPVSSPRSDIEGISGGSHKFESIEISEIRPEASSFDWNQILWNDNQNNITVKWSAVAPADAAGKNLNISFNVEYADRDSRRINNSIVIGDESTIISYYANENGRIGDREIFSAVRDWQRNNGFFEYRSREESNTLIFKLVRIWQQNN